MAGVRFVRMTVSRHKGHLIGISEQLMIKYKNNNGFDRNARAFWIDNDFPVNLCVGVSDRASSTSI
jgi:hypothetical protein